MCESLFVHNFDLFLYKARRARVTVENRVETDVLYTRAFDLFALIFSLYTCLFQHIKCSTPKCLRVPKYICAFCSVFLTTRMNHNIYDQYLPLPRSSGAKAIYSHIYMPHQKRFFLSHKFGEQIHPSLYTLIYNKLQNGKNTDHF